MPRIGTPSQPTRISNSLLASKARFIIPATLFFIVYYFTLPVLVGWFPKFMEQRVFGEVNLAYLFALSQFFMAWIIAFLYLARSCRLGPPGRRASLQIHQALAAQDGTMRAPGILRQNRRILASNSSAAPHVFVRSASED